jgi:hypothetical protein
VSCALGRVCVVYSGCEWVTTHREAELNVASIAYGVEKARGLAISSHQVHSRFTIDEVLSLSRLLWLKHFLKHVFIQRPYHYKGLELLSGGGGDD